MVQQWVLHWVPLWLIHFYANMKKDILTILLYCSERKNTLNYFQITSIYAMKNTRFTSEKETNDKLSFLNVELSREKNQFIASVLHKPRLSGVFSQFGSFIPRCYKFNLVLNSTIQCYFIYSSMKLCRKEIMQHK